jgi:hypothetical protein
VTASVIWVGTAKRAELACPCPTCGAYIGVECVTTVFKEVPHTERALRAEVFGFRDVQAPGGLFVDRRAQRVPMHNVLRGDL